MEEQKQTEEIKHSAEEIDEILKEISEDQAELDRLLDEEIERLYREYLELMESFNQSQSAQQGE